MTLKQQKLLCCISGDNRLAYFIFVLLFVYQNTIKQKKDGFDLIPSWGICVNNTSGKRKKCVKQCDDNYSIIYHYYYIWIDFGE